MTKHSATMRYNDCAGDCPEHEPHMTSDGEYVCIRCGTVLSDGEQDLQELYYNVPSTAAQEQHPKSNINLFLAHRLGGNEVKSLPGLSTTRSLEIAQRESSRTNDRGRKKRNVNSFLSRFSNACSKLGLTHAEAEHAWQLFARLYNELSEGDKRGCVNVSEIACYAIAAGSVNTTNGTRLMNESVLVHAIRFSFRTKVVRDMYYIRRAIETRTWLTTKITVKPSLTVSAKWMRGRY